jgi:transcriptional regulator with XRE-family HTH domain
MPTRKQPVFGPLVPLREVRTAHGLTLKELADRIEHLSGKRPDEGTLSNVETGKQFASQALIISWCRALRMNPIDVLQEPELRGILAASHPALRDRGAA